MGLIALPFSGPKKRSVDEVVNFLRAASNNTILPYDWNQFASKPIADKRLDAIRKRAAIAGPPNADKLMMRQLEKEARLLGTEE